MIKMEMKKRNLFKVEQHRISVQHSGCEKLGLDRRERKRGEIREKRRKKVNESIE
mgnify:CR=1 FL=1